MHNSLKSAQHYMLCGQFCIIQRTGKANSTLFRIFIVNTYSEL